MERQTIQAISEEEKVEFSFLDRPVQVQAAACKNITLLLVDEEKTPENVPATRKMLDVEISSDSEPESAENARAEVLIIDDQQVNVLAMQGQLSSFGVQSASVLSGEEALELLGRSL